MSKVYSANEVARHNQENDLWIVYKDGVYDVTKFLKEHPGGEEVLIELGGRDATKCFDDIGHTIEAVQLRETYKIGTVTGFVSGEPTGSSGGVQDTTIDDDNWEYTPPQYGTSHWLPVIIGTGVAIYAFLFYYLWF
ncbi:PREDICTED: cytochrome b5-like [Dufourea novaeangliae]|uniref:Cytochrome b5 n=1 Tax=Dufourea novaeangliae TaxID=178035 RepID=A0A154PP76_DUFNO|nr:PREDICTED: cytochrome b5-like [Dufourea novaeangliae]XP_015436387.1 PREDICTED: cytochrome b5-like [Dufourea novaeangliae]KZC13662.1 Cytochrome b5 [Dufourea novaeangliae]